MARPTKQGLDYFPLDVGFFGDEKIRILKARYQSDGVAIYIKLLCDIYKEGYYITINFDDYIFNMSYELGVKPNRVQEIISFLRNRAMIQVFTTDELT